MRNLHLSILGFVVTWLAGCASAPLVEHGIAPNVKGREAISNVQVQYGSRLIDFPGVIYPVGGGGWTAHMPVPDQMTVSWTVQGTRRQALVPLKDMLSPTRPLENWLLIFTDGELAVWREDLVEPPATPTGLRRRQSTQVFP